MICADNIFTIKTGIRTNVHFDISRYNFLPTIVAVAFFFFECEDPGWNHNKLTPPPLILEVEQVYVLPSRRPFLGHFSAPLSLIFKPIFSSKDTIYTWVFNKFKLFFLQNGFKINWYSLLKYFFFLNMPTKWGKNAWRFCIFWGGSRYPIFRESQL